MDHLDVVAAVDLLQAVRMDLVVELELEVEQVVVEQVRVLI